LYFNTDDVNALYTELHGTDGISGLTKPKDLPHGMREIAVDDPNGFRVVFGQPL
jgi:hypothetical protein